MVGYIRTKQSILKMIKKEGDEIQYMDLSIMEQYNFSYEFLFDLYCKLKR